MARVISTLVPNDEVDFSCKYIDDLAFALVTPLRA
jgi:hypothetical protein